MNAALEEQQAINSQQQQQLQKEVLAHQVCTFTAAMYLPYPPTRAYSGWEILLFSMAVLLIFGGLLILGLKLAISATMYLPQAREDNENIDDPMQGDEQTPLLSPQGNLSLSTAHKEEETVSYQLPEEQQGSGQLGQPTGNSQPLTEEALHSHERLSGYGATGGRDNSHANSGVAGKPRACSL